MANIGSTILEDQTQGDEHKVVESVLRAEVKGIGRLAAEGDQSKKQAYSENSRASCPLK